jgi:hypothetical protein
MPHERVETVERALSQRSERPCWHKDRDNNCTISCFRIPTIMTVATTWQEPLRLPVAACSTRRLLLKLGFHILVVEDTSSFRFFVLSIDRSTEQLVHSFVKWKPILFEGEPK